MYYVIHSSVLIFWCRQMVTLPIAYALFVQFFWIAWREGRKQNSSKIAWLELFELVSVMTLYSFILM